VRNIFFWKIFKLSFSIDSTLLIFSCQITKILTLIWTSVWKIIARRIATTQFANYAHHASRIETFFNLKRPSVNTKTKAISSEFFHQESTTITTSLSRQSGLAIRSLSNGSARNANKTLNGVELLHC
jgi:hypothetical protein